MWACTTSLVVAASAAQAEIGRLVRTAGPDTKTWCERGDMAGQLNAAERTALREAVGDGRGQVVGHLLDRGFGWAG